MRKDKLCYFMAVVLCVLSIAGLSSARTFQKNQYDLYDLKNKNYQYSVRIQSGYVTGTANEIVYAGSASDTLLSKLIWEIDELFMAGVGASMQKEWVAVHADLWFRATDGDGTMDDYDWLFNGPDWSDWSHHDDTIINNAYTFDLNCEFLIPKISTGKFALGVILGYKREFYEWEARGGSYIYSSNPGWRDTIGNFGSGELGITYSQTYDTPYIGLGMRGNIAKFELSARIIASPLAMVTAKDTHHLTGMDTVADMSMGNMYSMDVTASYKFTSRFALEVSYAHTEYDTMRGDSQYQWSNGMSALFEDLEGADLKTDRLSVVLAYLF